MTISGGAPPPQIPPPARGLYHLWRGGVSAWRGVTRATVMEAAVAHAGVP
jgi:hypothetical protein